MKTKSTKTIQKSLRRNHVAMRFAKTEKPVWYTSPVSQKTDPAVDAARLFETVNQERQMSNTKPCDMEGQSSDWEHRHNLRCLWSQVIGNRTIQVECMWWPVGNATIMVTKHYERPIPRPGRAAGKPWPKMIAHYAYFPLDNGTWEGIDRTMASIKPQYTEEEIHTA